MKNNLPLIVQVSSYYPPHTGGMERVAKMSAEAFARRGYPVQVITSTSSGIKRGTEENHNLRVTALWSFEFAHTPIAPMLLWHLLTLPKNSLIHLHLAQAYYPELVWLVSKLRGIPYIVHFHLDIGPSGILGPFFVLYKRMIWGPVLRGARMVVACAADQVEIIEKRFNVPKENIAVILNAVSDDFFSNRAYVPPTKEFRLLYVGRLSLQKRVERLIEAMSRLTIPARLTIVGDGEDRESLEALAKKLRLENISFEGKRDDAEMQRYHREHDTLLISSDLEGTALVVLEAMAAGLPVIGTNIKGIRELVQGAGILIDEPYAENFAKVIEDLWRTPEKLVVLSKQSVEKAQQYRWPRFMGQLEEVYREVSLQK